LDYVILANADLEPRSIGNGAIVLGIVCSRNRWGNGGMANQRRESYYVAYILVTGLDFSLNALVKPVGLMGSKA